MALQAEEAVGQGIIALLLQKIHGQKLAAGFGHFSGSGVQVEDMHPIFHPGMAKIGLGLGDFVGVVGEGVVDAAAVDVRSSPRCFIEMPEHSMCQPG